MQFGLGAVGCSETVKKDSKDQFLSNIMPANVMKSERKATDEDRRFAYLVFIYHNLLGNAKWIFCSYHTLRTGGDRYITLTVYHWKRRAKIDKLVILERAKRFYTWTQSTHFWLLWIASAQRPTSTNNGRPTTFFGWRIEPKVVIARCGDSLCAPFYLALRCISQRGRRYSPKSKSASHWMCDNYSLLVDDRSGTYVHSQTLGRCRMCIGMLLGDFFHSLHIFGTIRDLQFRDVWWMFELLSLKNLQISSNLTIQELQQNISFRNVNQAFKTHHEGCRCHHRYCCYGFGLCPRHLRRSKYVK